MRVMCINDQFTNPEPGEEGKPTPKYGEVDNVLESRYVRTGLYYSLERFGPDMGFAADHFIPLQSDTAPEIEIEQLQPIHA